MKGCLPFGSVLGRNDSALARVTITHGVSVHCGWANPRPEYGKVPGVQCPNEWPWKAMRTRDRIPALGEYDERKPAVTVARVEWMRQGRIDYACYQTEWDHRSHELLMAHCADNHPAGSPVAFCLSFWDVLAGSSDSYLPAFTPEMIEASLRAYARAVAGYMQRPNYLRVDDNPVLFRGYPHNLQYYQRFGFTPSGLVKIMREEIGPLYLVGTCTDPVNFPLLKDWGFDAFTEYLLYSDTWAGAVGIYRQRWNEAIEICKRTGIDYWVPATCGYNSAAWGSPVPQVFMPTPAEFTAHLKEARALAQKHARYTRGQVCIYAWNELGEAGILEPLMRGMIHDGDEMLRAHAAAVA